MAFWKIAYKQVALNELSPFFKIRNMGRKYGIHIKKSKWLKRHCEQDMPDIKLVTIRYSKHIYEIDWLA